jgi:hypothetical protein
MNDLYNPNLEEPNPKPPRNFLGGIIVFFCCMVISTIIIIAIAHDANLVDSTETPKQGREKIENTDPEDARMEWLAKRFGVAMAISGFLGLLVILRRPSSEEKESSTDEENYR